MKGTVAQAWVCCCDKKSCRTARVMELPHGGIDAALTARLVREEG
jgi:hypothetical protein